MKADIEDVIERIGRKFAALRPMLSERARRLWAGAEADALGRGGVAWVARATGIAISTVRKGRDELRRGGPGDLVRDRRRGAGRRPLEIEDPELVPCLEALVSPTTRGDPENALRWSCKSLRVLSRELTAQAHPVGPDKVGELLRAAGYSLQAAAKTKEGIEHADRDAQFSFINERAKDFTARGLPVISVDAKKKELVGEHANRAREWQLKGKPIEVLSHDLFDGNVLKATPYGIYDVTKNVGFVNVGTSNNTPTFAVRSIEKWWDRMGAQTYPVAKSIFLTADSGGSNNAKSTVWKSELQNFADRTGLEIFVSHFPPGTSKWNKIEHRLFSFVTLNWRGRVLASYETVVSLIAATTTSKGLTVQAELDRAEYALGKSIDPGEMATLFLEAAPFHGEWNYVLRPRTEAQRAHAMASRNLKSPVVTRAERRSRWIPIVLEYRQSGLSLRTFCKQRGVNRNAFRYAVEYIVRRQIRRRSPKAQ